MPRFKPPSTERLEIETRDARLSIRQTYAQDPDAIDTILFGWSDSIREAVRRGLAPYEIVDLSQTYQRLDRLSMQVTMLLKGGASALRS